ncbi:MAG: phosphatidylserine decarboxylase [Alphaproteobacteria bacterium]|nr:phosphatidylserine decarboxylase [Alphaproteobacteria bacterium]
MKKNNFNHLKDFLRNSIIPYAFPHINKEGWKFVPVFALITALLALAWAPLGWIGLILTIWCYFFFRDPERVVPQTENVVVAPADGKVQMITKVKAPNELEMGDEEFTRISIFMSVFNVHVNRAPAKGKILKTVYIKGKFLNADLDKASEDNERQLLAMETASGQKIAFVQIAGLVARRILCWAKEGQNFEAGERFGLIRFGSRLDVYLPQGIEPQVYVGQTMVAGETILANFAMTKAKKEAK